MSTPPQNPYAQHPQYQQYPQQGYGGQPPYPQPGYGQQPYPGPGGPGYGWGAPPPPPPKKNTGRIVAITLGSVAALLALSWFGNNVTLRSGGGSDGGFPEAEYQLTLPQTLLDGKYKLADNMSEKFQDELSHTSEANIRDTQGSMAQYVSEAEGGVLVVSGMHGRIKDPDKARSMILKGSREADGATVAVAPEGVDVVGSDITITCQVLTHEQEEGGTATLPMCAWADDNTNATVALVTPETATQSPEEIDLKVVAEATVKIRGEIRKPIG